MTNEMWFFNECYMWLHLQDIVSGSTFYVRYLFEGDYLMCWGNDTFSHNNDHATPKNWVLA